MMRPRRWIPAFLLVLTIVAAGAAQTPRTPKKGARSAPAPASAPATPAAPAADREEAPGPAATPAPPPDDLGPAPPRASRSTSTGLSPLNPAAAEFPSGKAPAAPPNYDALLTEIAALRSRVAALTATLFRSRLRVSMETVGDESRIAHLVLTLDDGVVFNGGERFIAEKGRTVYEHAVAPGHHVIGVELERYDVRDPKFRTWQTSRFSVVVPENKILDTAILLEEDSDMAEDFPEDEEGVYELNVRLRAWVDS